MKVGYARISTGDQNLDLQIDSLKRAGCDRIFQDVLSGAKTQRQGLDDALEFLREGDTLVVWKLDRLGRSLEHLLKLCNSLGERNVEFRSLRENIDTSTAVGKLFFHIIASLAEFEREIIRDRTKAGLAAARSRGRLGGRKKSLDESQIKMAKAMMDSDENKVGDICKMLGISKTTLYRYTRWNEREPAQTT